MSKSIQPRYTVTKVEEPEEVKTETPQVRSPDSENDSHKKRMSLFYGDKKQKGVSLNDFLGSFYGPVPGVRDTKKKANLNVIIGVFLPNVQNVFGILMFLRLYWIVGVAGVIQSFILVLICCMCTFLTSISVSAIATNGVIQAGGPYFLISRNLGAGVGAGVGLLFFIANAVATSMYVAGAIEILVKYMAPGMPVFMTTPVIIDMTNTTRAYGTGLMIILFVLLSMGVRYVQMFAPLSLVGVIVSVVAIYLGSFTAGDSRPREICLVDGRLLRYHMWNNDTDAMCHNRTEGLLYAHFCGNASNEDREVPCAKFLDTVESRNGFPGFVSGVIKTNLYQQYNDEPERKNDYFIYQKLATTFFVLLAIYFPSVTGIMTGCNMSGDLRDPQRDIPRGTIGAQIFTSFVYLCFVVIFGGCIEGVLLRDQYGDAVDGGHDPQGKVRGGGMIIAYFAWPPTKWIVQIGAFTSTFGAAIQSLVSAPRLLQAIAKDDVVPAVRWFAKLRKNGEPWIALCLTCFIAEVFLLLGDVDPIAEILGYFFLICYTFINLSCAVQTMVGAPNWRPRYTYYHWTLAVFGALLNFFVMIAANWKYALIVFIFWGLINVYVHYKGAKKEWGTGMRGLALSTAQQSLLCFEEHDVHPKNWRPQFLIMLKPNDIANIEEWRGEEDQALKPQRKAGEILEFVRQMRGGKGLAIAVSVLDGKVTNSTDRELAKAVRKVLKDIMRKTKIQGFTNMVIDSSDGSAIGTMLQTFGIGGLRPNTLVVGWPLNVIAQVTQGKSGNTKDFNILWDCLQCAASGGMAVLLVKGFGHLPTAKVIMRGTIDVWWIMEDGGLLMLLPFLLQKSRNWRKCQLRVFAIASESDDKKKMKEALEKWCYQLRIDAQVKIVTLANEAIGDYVAERTLKMQERLKLARELQMTHHEAVKNPQLVIDAARSKTAVPDPSPAGVGSPLSASSSTTSPSSGAGASTTATMTEDELQTFLKTGKSAKSRKGGKEPGKSAKEGKEKRGPASAAAKVIAAPKGTVGEKLAEESAGPKPTEERKTSGMDRSSDEDSESEPTKQRDTTAPQKLDTASKTPKDRTTSPTDQHSVEEQTAKSSERIQLPQQPGQKLLSPIQELPAGKEEAEEVWPPIKSPKVAAAELLHSHHEDTQRGGSSISETETKLYIAVHLNRVIKAESSKADLVVVNLPSIPRSKLGFLRFISYLETMSEGLERMLLVKGTGKEVVTIYS